MTGAIVGAIAVSVIAHQSARDLDKIRFQMQMQARDHNRKMKGMERRQSTWLLHRNQQKLREAHGSVQLATEINQMKEKAKLVNAVSAAGVDDSNALVRDLERQHLRQEMYQLKDQANDREQLKVSAIDSTKSGQIQYDPTPAMSSNTMWTQFGIDALQIGQRAFGEYTASKGA